MVSLNVLRSRIANAPGMARNIVIIVAVIAAGIASTGYILSHYGLTSPVADKFEFSADFDMAPAIQPDTKQEVRIAGVPVGRVIGAKPTADGARLSFAIDNDQKIYRDARLVIRSKTPLNIVYVALNPGTTKAGELPEGETIPVTQTERFTQAFEVLDKLDARARSALTDLVYEADVALTSAPEQLPEGLDALTTLSTTAEPLVKALDERRTHLRRIVTALSLIAEAAGKDDQRLDVLVDALQSTLSTVAARDRELDATLAQLPGVTTELTSALDEVSTLTDELDPVLDQAINASDRLPATADRLTSTVINARELLTTAGPVIAKARPILRDLRPLTADLDAALTNLRPVTANLPPLTEKLTPWLTNLGGFVYNTSSSFSLGDANGGMGRANVVVEALEPTGAPIGDLLP
jgi:phospholipid/cholesterol/gamma-HCH transport system substrate-binding protein